jgi:hypothetical protein
VPRRWKAHCTVVGQALRCAFGALAKLSLSRSLANTPSSSDDIWPVKDARDIEREQEQQGRQFLPTSTGFCGISLTGRAVPCLVSLDSATTNETCMPTCLFNCANLKADLALAHGSLVPTKIERLHCASPGSFQVISSSTFARFHCFNRASLVAGQNQNLVFALHRALKLHMHSLFCSCKN